MSYRLKWNIKDKYTIFNIDYVITMLEMHKPKLLAIDTETTGLNIINDVPFLLIIAYKLPNQINNGYCFVVEASQNNLFCLYNYLLSQKRIVLVGTNIKYDLHMLKNINAAFPYESFIKNSSVITDIRIVNQLITPVDSVYINSNNLKELATRLIDENANQYEHKIHTIKLELEKQKRTLLDQALKKYKSSYSKIKQVLDNVEADADQISKEVWEIYNDFLEHHNGMNVNYFEIFKSNPEEMTQYAWYDGVFTIEVFIVLYEILVYKFKRHKGLDSIFNNENKLIWIYYKMERIGFKVDLDYLIESKIKVKKFIIDSRKKLFNLLGQKINENQHKELINILQNKFNVDYKYFQIKRKGEEKVSLDKSILNNLLTHPDDQIKCIAKHILKLRTAVKWLNTYIENIINEANTNKDCRIHPQNNQCGAVSGRISSTLQQLPRQGLLDFEEKLLYDPRKAIIPSGGGFKTLVFNDYDQMELRVQAHYTIAINSPDLNLCRVFIPYQCRNENQKLYEWSDKYKIDEHQWYYDENHKWEAIDPHGIHVKSAFGYDETHPEWKKLRNAAKIINFSINYGSSLNGLLNNAALQDYSPDIITKIYNAYQENFTGIVNYNRWVDNLVSNNGYVNNIYGRVYELQNPRNSYKVGNYIIQGSCADLVKYCLVEIDRYLTQMNARSRILYTIHDEIIWELFDDEKELINIISQIISNCSDWCLIPLTCKTATTCTNWKDKHEIVTIKEN